MSTPLHVLIVEDNEDDVLLLLHELKRGGYDVTHERVETAETMRAALRRGAAPGRGWDLVLSDNAMPHFGSVAALGVLQESGLDLPFIIVSGAIGEQAAVGVMKAGAHDYIMKGNLKRLTAAIERELREASVRRERKRAEGEIRRRAEQLAILNVTAVRIQQCLASQEICKVACDELRRFGAFASIFVVVDDRLDHVYTSMSEEALREYVARFGDTQVTLTFPLAAISDLWQRLQTGEATVESELVARALAALSADARRVGEWMQSHSPRGDVLLAPLMRAGAVIGLIILIGEKIGASDLPAVGLFARHVSVALENARWFTETTRRAKELEVLAQLSAALRTVPTRVEMLPVILDQLLDALKVKGATLATRDPVTGDVMLEFGRGAWAGFSGLRLPPGGGLSGHVIATGQLYQSDDVLSDPRLARPDLMGNLRAAVCCPLIVQEQTIGALWVGRETPIGESEVRLLTAIADLAANAIHRAALHEQTERRLCRAQALYTIDRAISSSMDLRVTLSVILEHALAQLRVDAADILLLDQHLLTLQYIVGRGFRSTAIERSRLRLGEGIAGRAALECCLLNVSYPAAGPASEARGELLAGENFVAHCCVPLVAKGQVKGVMEIFHRAPLASDPEWLEFLRGLAGQAAIAIDNIELFINLQRSNTELALAYDTTLEGWSRALDLRDKETEGHTQRVTEMTERLARALGVNESELAHIRRGALLHDIGKMGIPDAILLKPGALTEQEWVTMRKHPIYAYELLSPIAYLRPALDIPYCHHEKWDGTGYPRGLQGERIPLAARLFAVVDVWDALRSDRPYRLAWTEEKAREYLRAEAGKHFDPKVVRLCLESDLLATHAV